MLTGAARRDAYVRRKRKHALTARLAKRHGRWMDQRQHDGRWKLVVTPGSVAVRARNHAKRREPGHDHGVVTGWSPRSKRRFRLRMASIPWREVAYVFLTLTYPDEFPHDPEVWKRQLHAFFQAWSRQYGTPKAVWVLEFQRRGAPHFHIVFEAPESVQRARGETEGMLELSKLRRWYAGTWHRIVTGCDGDHARARDLGEGCVPWHYERHLEVEHCKSATGAREAISYLERELGKENQKSLPAYLDVQEDGEARGAGRWWGVVGFRPDVEEISVTRHEYVTLRHAILRLGREVQRREIAHRERIRLWKLSKGLPWTPRPKPSGRWLSPRSINDGVVVMDPDLRAYSFARAFRALLTDMRRPIERVDGEVYSAARAMRDVLARIERSKPIVFGWA